MTGWPKGRKLSEEHRSKLRGRIPWNKGKTDVYSPEVLAQMRKIKIGKTMSVGVGIKISMATKGKKRSDSTKMKMSLSKMASNNPQWKGDDNLHMTSLHEWVRNHFSKPDRCQQCNHSYPNDLSNISPKYDPTTYNRDLKNWLWLCRRCHMISDGRLQNLNQRKED